MLTEGTTRTNIKKQDKCSVRPGHPPAPIPKKKDVQPKDNNTTATIIKNILI